MFERAVNVFWIALGVATAAYSYTVGLIGASGPESGLFPFITALIVTGAGIAAVCSASSADSPSWRWAFRGWASPWLAGSR